MWIESAHGESFVRYETLVRFHFAPNSYGDQFTLQAQAAAVSQLFSLTYGTREFCLGEMHRIIKAARTPSAGKEAQDTHKVNLPGKEQEREPRKAPPEPSAGEIARGLTGASMGR